MRRAWREVLLGARIALGGGRSGLIRAGLTAVGVGLGVAVLLLAASLPHVIATRHERTAARDDVSVGTEEPAPSDRTILVGYADTAYHGTAIRGRLLQPEGPNAPVPPGIDALPPAGQMVVSPALRRLLESPEGSLLRQRLNYPIAGTIGDAGLGGPTDLAFYLGSDSLSDGGQTVRRDHFGEPYTSEALDPVLLLLVVIIFVVLLVPVGMFVAAAVRFGGEGRDRRLAGVRLVGADAGMARRIAAGEALLSALIGLVIGGAIFLIGRSFVDRIVIFGASVFPADVRPSAALGALIAIAVPAAAVGVTIASLRRVVVEPLGVTRRSGDVKRRVWWRILLPVVGVALLVPYFGRLSKSGGSFSTGVVVLAVGLILVGVATLLPWVVQATVRRVRGGPVSWQLAVRRMQLEGASSARAVTGIAVAVAGAIGLQMLFGGVRGGYVSNTDVTGVVAEASLPLRQGVDGIDAVRSIIAATPGVKAVDATVRLDGHAGNDDVAIYVGDCPTLGRLATLPSCRDGDVFRSYVDNAADKVPVAGRAVRIETDQPVDWIVPDAARAVPNRASAAGLLVTPGALPAAVRDDRALYLTARVSLDEADPDALDRLRNTVWGIDPTTYVNQIAKHVESDRLAQIRLGLYVGAVVTLLLIGASLLVTVLEQLRDRRRLLATLTAFGTRRRTIAWSIMWQTTIPVVLGVAVAVAAGIGLGAALQRMASAPLSIHWSVVGVMSGIAAAVVLLVTALSLPALFRVMRPEGLRAE